MAVLTVNLEQGMPTVEMARQRLGAALRSARAQEMQTLKLIHGYGSSGQGGRIRTMVRTELKKMQQDGKVRVIVAGEAFSPFKTEAQQAIALCYELTKDHDYTRCNHGVTVVVL